jgi:hypothetical protein
MLKPKEGPRPSDDQPEHFKIKVKGHLGSSWSECFSDLKVTHTQSGETILAGPITDQAELHGILARIRDLNLALISVTQIES